MVELPGQANTRLAVTEALLTPATGVGFAASLHHWGHQPWWAVIPTAVVFALTLGALRWWQYRR
jgi:hypothetical protein